MITWVTVWVLSLALATSSNGYYRPNVIQLQYASQQTCEKQKQSKLKDSNVTQARCDFQQIPIATK